MASSTWGMTRIDPVRAMPGCEFMVERGMDVLLSAHAFRGLATSDSMRALQSLRSDGFGSWNLVRPIQTNVSGGRKWHLATSVIPSSSSPRICPRSKLWDGSKTRRFSRPSLYLRSTRVEGAHKSIISELDSEFNFCFSSLEVDDRQDQFNGNTTSLSTLLGLSAFICYSGPAYASENRTLSPVYGDLGDTLESGVQLLYLGALLVLLGVGSYLVVRQILIKRQLETAAKDLQDRVRSGEASSLEYFELGAVMLRKKFYQLARKYLNEAINKWDGAEQDVAQVYNALGFSYFSDGMIDQAITQYQKAVKLQPMYVTAWNNLADAYETKKDFVKALKAYEEALQFDPNNKVAKTKQVEMKERAERFQGIP